MPQLDNLQHEKFVHNLIESKSQTEAYQKTFPGLDANSSAASASRLLTLESVRNRILELMNVKVTPERVVDKLSQHLDSENEGISMDAVKTSLKVMGGFSEERNAVSIDTVNIVFGDVVKGPDTIKDAAPLSIDTTNEETKPSIDTTNNG